MKVLVEARRGLSNHYYYYFFCNFIYFQFGRRNMAVKGLNTVDFILSYPFFSLYFLSIHLEVPWSNLTRFSHVPALLCVV